LAIVKVPGVRERERSHAAVVVRSLLACQLRVYPIWTDRSPSPPLAAHLVGAGVVEIVRLVTVVVPDTAFRDGPDARSGDVADNCGEL
jgi:hypothetical protein